MERVKEFLLVMSLVNLVIFIGTMNFYLLGIALFSFVAWVLLKYKEDYFWGDDE